MAERVQPIAFIERHQPQIDSGPRLVAHDPRQRPGLLQALREDELDVRADRLPDREPGARVGFRGDEPRVEPEIRRAALHARRIEPDRAPGGFEKVAGQQPDELLAPRRITLARGPADEQQRHQIALGPVCVVGFERRFERGRRAFERDRDLVALDARDGAQVEIRLDAVRIREIDRSPIRQPIARAVEEHDAALAQLQAAGDRG